MINVVEGDPLRIITRTKLLTSIKESLLCNERAVYM